MKIGTILERIILYILWYFIYGRINVRISLLRIVLLRTGIQLSIKERDELLPLDEGYTLVKKLYPLTLFKMEKDRYLEIHFPQHAQKKIRKKAPFRHMRAWGIRYCLAFVERHTYVNELEMRSFLCFYSRFWETQSLTLQEIQAEFFDVLDINERCILFSVQHENITYKCRMEGLGFGISKNVEEEAKSVEVEIEEEMMIKKVIRRKMQGFITRCI